MYCHADVLRQHQLATEAACAVTDISADGMRELGGGQPQVLACHVLPTLTVTNDSRPRLWTANGTSSVM